MTIHQRSSTTLTTAATVLPLSLNEVKDYLGIQDSDESEDPSLMGALRAATLSAERYTRRTFVTTTWTIDLHYPEETRAAKAHRRNAPPEERVATAGSGLK